LSGLRAALSFLTILPAGGHEEAGANRLGRAWFPAVGLLLGAAAWCAFWAGATFFVPLVAAVAAVTTLAILTGGLHLDGLADAADGLLGGTTRERRLEIMRDSRIGAFGVIALVLVLIFDVAALSGLTRFEALAALVTAAGLGRLAMVCVLLALPYVRPAGLGGAAQGGRRLADLAVAAIIAALPIALDWRHGLVACGFAAISTLAVAALARARIGGTTGDVYGAVVEVAQLSALLGFALRI
jgi:adenosylcobinamide-GDP ribazoletransferase